MLLEAHRPVPLPHDSARAALHQALSDGGLVEESRRAFADGADFLMRVGPSGGSAPSSKEVLVRWLPAREVGTTLVVPLRWEPTGPTASLFPTLDAKLGLTPAGEMSSLLSIVGEYVPPLGPLGSAIDHALMTRAARRTASALLDEVVRKIRSLSSPT
ncbi:MAG TPA: hypothetical protein VFJ17_00055 [Mycobacteriales bacterium]|jgi:hypothetical protein|nr:hypothetical protein [Mycobacteriales bacterium]